MGDRMSTLIFDTETTGLVNRDLPATHPKQPMPVQIGMKLDDDVRNERGVTNQLIIPVGWSMEAKAAELTGLSDQIAYDFGTSLQTAVELFLDWVEVADVIVAHNAMFDITVMRRATKVYCDWEGVDYFDPFEGKTLICTMVATTPILQLPPKRNGEYKWPKLEECMKFFFNESIEGAHDALVDVKACAKLFYHLMDEGIFA